MEQRPEMLDRKSTRLNSSHTVIYTLSLHDALPISMKATSCGVKKAYSDPDTPGGTSAVPSCHGTAPRNVRSEEHTSELQSHRDLHSFPTRRSSDLNEGDLLWCEEGVFGS